MGKNCVYRLVIEENGQYGVVYKDNEREVLDHPFKTYEEAYRAAERRFLMLKHLSRKHDRVEGTPDDFTNAVRGGKHARFSDHYFIEETEQKCMYRLICIRNGQYGFTHRDNEREVLDHPFNTYEEAYRAAERRYSMLKHVPGEHDELVGSPEDFTITVKNTDKADFSDHYFIEEIAE